MAMAHEKDTAQTGQKSKKTAAQQREERLKAALKSNMGRRKAQSRARVAAEPNAESTADDAK